MRVLVTGATGYVGGAIARALKRDGRDVVGAARASSLEAVRAAGYEAILGDLADPASLVRAVEGCDAVVHAGAVNGPERAATDRAAVEAMLGALRQRGAGAFIYTSGTWVLGDTGDAVATEKWPCRPLEVNAWQLEVEELVQSAFAGGVRTAIVRPATVHGEAGGSLAAFLAQTAKRGAPRVVGSGHQMWSTVHLDDVAELYARVLRGIDAGGVFHAASGCAYPARDLALAAAHAAGGDRVEPWPIDEARARLGAIADAMGMTQRVEAVRSRTVLGWVPRGPTALEDLLSGSYRRS